MKFLSDTFSSTFEITKTEPDGKQTSNWVKGINYLRLYAHWVLIFKGFSELISNNFTSNSTKVLDILKIGFASI